LEDELHDMDRCLARAGHRPPTPVPGPPPVVIDLTDLSDDEEDEGLLVDEEMVGGPIELDEVQIRQEMPPSQELLEALRLTPIRDEDNAEYNREADLLVRAGLALPEYEDPPEYY